MPSRLSLLLQVIQRVLAGLKGRYNTQEGKPVLGVVQLTGLAHTEDVVAFREIARQLCKYVGPFQVSIWSCMTVTNTQTR